MIIKKCFLIFDFFFFCCVHPFPFWASLFIKRPYNVFLATFIMFKNVKVGKRIDYISIASKVIIIKKTCLL